MVSGWVVQNTLDGPTWTTLCRSGFQQFEALMGNPWGIGLQWVWALYGPFIWAKMISLFAVFCFSQIWLL